VEIDGRSSQITPESFFIKIREILATEKREIMKVVSEPFDSGRSRKCMKPITGIPPSKQLETSSYLQKRAMGLPR